MAKTDLAVELYYSGGWQTATAYSRNPVTATWGVTDEGGGLTPGRCTLTLDNRTGNYGPDNPASALYGLIGRNTPAQVVMPTAGLAVAQGSASSWAPDRAVKGDAWTDVEITGPSQRVNASKTVLSALAGTVGKTITDGSGPAAYWPMEGYTEQPDVVASAVPGVADATLHVFSPSVASAFDWRGDDTLPGSQNLPVLESNRTSLAGLEAAISVPPDPALGMSYWTRTTIPATDVAHSINTQVIDSIYVNNGPISFSLVLVTYPPGSSLATVPDDGEIQVRVNQSTGPTLDQSILITDIPYVDGWRHVYASLSPSGSDVAVSIRIDNTVVGTGTLTGVALGTITKTFMSAFTQDATGTESGRVATGHWTLLSDSVSSMDAFAALQYEAGLGYPGEACDDRFWRLCDEHNIYATIYGSDAKTMGVQRPDTLPNLLTEIARTEGGMIYDQRAGDGLELRTGASLYNQSAALALTYGTDVAPPIRPVTDDLGISNDITATLRAGGTARATRTTGPLNVSDPVDDPQGIGRVESRIDVNTEDAAALRDVAGWALHLSTFPGARYRNVTIDVGTHPEHLEAVMSLRPGDLITIDDLAADLVELIVLGGTDVVESHAQRATLTCAPGGPYRIAAVAGSGHRVGAAASTLVAAFNAGVGTSFQVASADSLWSTTDEPYHARVGGVVVNVTAVTGASSPQTFTVDAATVNGITRTVPAGSPVTIETPIYVAR